LSERIDVGAGGPPPPAAVVAGDAAGWLAALVARVEAAVDTVDFTPELARYTIGADHRRYLRSKDKPYLWRAALVRELGARRVLEVGTKTGVGALALAKFAERVVACDLDLSRVHDPAIFDGRVRGVELAGPDDCLTLDFPAFDLVVVDVDHLGTTEAAIHRALAAGYRGVVLYDDIEHNPPMRRFWEAIDRPKVATRWHPPHGTGLVLYGGGREAGR
jgi:SAM-dependent methyltransferase